MGPSNQTGFYNTDSGGVRGEADVMMGAETGGTHFEYGGRGHEARNTGSH